MTRLLLFLIRKTYGIAGSYRVNVIKQVISFFKISPIRHAFLVVTIPKKYRLIECGQNTHEITRNGVK